MGELSYTASIWLWWWRRSLFDSIDNVHVSGSDRLASFID